MRGEVLFYDEVRGSGFITGDDGNRYTFLRSDLKQKARLAKGLRLDFRTEGDRARDMFLVDAEPETPAPPVAARVPDIAATADKERPRPVRVPEIARDGDDPGLFAYFQRCVSTDYLNFRGRARRKEYWGFVLFALLIYLVLGAAGMAVDAALESDEPYVTGLLLGIVSLALLLPGIAVTVRRIHDIGLSGWFVLLSLLPYFGGLIMIVFALIPSRREDNKWGPPPVRGQLRP